MQMLLHALVAALYLGAMVALWRAPARGAARVASPEVATGPGFAFHAVVAVAWLLHAWLLRDDALVDGTWRFGFALALSATMWLVLLLFRLESLVVDVPSIWIVILPLAAVCVLIPLAFPGSAVLGRISGADGGGEGGAWLPLHLGVALAAYGLMTIAAVHALFMAALDRWLHREGSAGWLPDGSSSETEDERRNPVQHRMLAPLPPLMTMERVLFRLIGAGFILLTLTVLTGIVFSEALFGRPLRLDHKTVFTLIAWLTFGALLAGRAMRGWRGRVALSWTLSGFAMLFLAYAGSRFVLEVVLHRV